MNSVTFAHAPSPFLLPDDEDARLACLMRHDLDGTPIEPIFDQLADMAATLFGVSVCLISVIGHHHQGFIGRHGFDQLAVPRALSLCNVTLQQDGVRVVSDLSLESAYLGHPLVHGITPIRFYAGTALVSADGVRLGTFCIVDGAARAAFSDRDRALLQQLAAMAARALDTRRGTLTGVAARRFVESTAMAVVTANREGTISFWNAAAESLFGWPARTAIGCNLALIIPERFREAHQKGMARLMAGGVPTLAGKTVEVQAIDCDDREFPIELTLSHWKDGDGLGLGAHIQDISERRAREARLRHLAHHDELTGLLNRRGFSACVETAIRDVRDATILALDLDSFKGVNDAFGHAVGDAFLQALSVRLTSATPDGSALGRIGGDEFAILLPPGTSANAACAAARAVLAACVDPIVILHHHLQVGISIGIAIAPLHAADVEELMVRADLALFRSKREGGRAYYMFDADMARELTKSRAIKMEIGRAATNREWMLLYQPQVALRDDGLVAAEALLRWSHPHRGVLLPSAFMTTLETHAAAFEVGCWVIDRACRQLVAWRAAGLGIERIAVNLFAAQIRSGNLATIVGNALVTHGLRPQDIELEITESIALRQDEGIDQLQALHDIGVAIAFDDFGTGFASLATLKHFPLSRLKIDRSFVSDLGANAHSDAIVGGVIAIGHRLNLSVIAEGIETREQARALTEMGCDEGQGYLYGRPMSGDALLQRFRKRALFPV